MPQPSVSCRYVRYGARFTAKPGHRPAGSAPHAGQAESHDLFENELVLDVGGSLWGHDNETRPILDHHFDRPHQFPCASAAVLHEAARIHQRFSHCETVHLVTHVSPDFDALCACYLAGELICAATAPPDWSRYGIKPGAWNPRPPAPDLPGDFDWLNPRFGHIPADLRWQPVLASVAAHVDNGRRVKCRRNRRLHCILYAAFCRGRDYGGSHGGRDFFAAARQRIDAGWNPIWDSIFEDVPEFLPELRLLDEAEDRFQHDLNRARKVLVNLPTIRSDSSYHRFYEERQKIQLLDMQDQIRAEHLATPDQRYEQVPGIYLRDPECILFKEWAREEGYLFTAIAYSNGRPGAPVNQTDYYFSLDPERADKRHLYHVWSRLQHAEIPHLKTGGFSGPARRGFEKRAVGAWFDDPWFDAPNYNGTLIATPNRGSLLAAPAHPRPDLLDDPVVEIVRREIEASLYPSAFEITDFATKPGVANRDFKADASSETSAHAPGPQHLRFVGVTVQPSVEFTAFNSHEISHRLWRLLNGATAGEIPPPDFASVSLVADRHRIAVWSRYGLAMAHRPADAGAVKEQRETLAEIAAIRKEIAKQLDHAPSETALAESDPLLLRAARLKSRLTDPGFDALHRLFNTIEHGDILETVRDLHSAAAERVRETLKSRLEYLEIFILTVYVTEFTKIVVEFWIPGEHALGLRFVALVPLAFVAVCGYVFRPKLFTSHPDVPKNRFWAMAVALILLLLWGLYAAFIDPPPRHAGSPTGASVVEPEPRPYRLRWGGGDAFRPVDWRF